MPAYRERVVRFGMGEGLVGVLAMPSQPAAPAAPFVVLINSGLIHRVGPSRLHVLLARDLAAAGLGVLRFDLSGIGDSERQADAMPLQAAVERDIVAALDFLEAKHGAERFVLAGLCSGAYDAFRVAQDDSRVASAVLLDIPGPFGGWWHVIHHLRLRALNRQSWRQPLQKLRFYGRTLRHLVLGGKAPTMARYRPGVRLPVSRQSMGEAIDALIERDVRLFFLFTAGMPGNYNHRSQFRRAFPRSARHPALTHAFLPEADHLFSTHASRSRAIQMVRDWVLRVAARSLPLALLADAALLG